MERTDIPEAEWPSWSCKMMYDDGFNWRFTGDLLSEAGLRDSGDDVTIFVSAGSEWRSGSKVIRIETIKGHGLDAKVTVSVTDHGGQRRAAKGATVRSLLYGYDPVTPPQRNRLQEQLDGLRRVLNDAGLLRYGMEPWQVERACRAAGISMPSPGDLICRTHCPCCEADLEVMYGDDPGEIGVVGTPTHELRDMAEECGMTLPDVEGVVRLTFGDEDRGSSAAEPANSAAVPAQGMCYDVAPGRVAVLVPPGPDGVMRTPWCHLPKGHEGPHRCGEYRW